MYTTNPYPEAFTKGKKVRFVGTYPSHFLTKGEVYTVRLATEHTLFLDEVFGPIFQPRHFELVEDKPVKPEHTTAQEKAIVGGLQPHSVGKAYPLGIVAYSNGDTTLYTVENVAAGTVACLFDIVLQYSAASAACELLGIILSGKVSCVVFKNGRPQFDGHGCLELPTIAGNKPPQVGLD